MVAYTGSSSGLSASPLDLYTSRDIVRSGGHVSHDFNNDSLLDIILTDYAFEMGGRLIYLQSTGELRANGLPEYVKSTIVVSGEDYMFRTFTQPLVADVS